MPIKIKRGHKYHAVAAACGRPECGKHKSTREAVRCGELQCLLKGKLIRDLKYQPKYDLYASVDFRDPHRSLGISKIGTYTADWSYVEFDQGAWVPIVEDLKGMVTAVFRLKQKILKANYNIELRITK